MDNDTDKMLPKGFEEISELIHRVAAADYRNHQLGAKTSAESVAQSAIKSALANIDQFNGQSEFEFFAWLRVILERKWLQRMRALRTQKRDIGREVSGDAHAADQSTKFQLTGNELPPERQILEKEINGKIREALATVSNQNREVLVLRYFYDLSYGEIAKKLNVSVGAVSGRLLRGVSELKETLGSDLFDD